MRIDGFYNIVAVFLNGIVAAGRAVCLGTVVIHGKASAEIEVAHRRTFFDELFIYSACLQDTGAYVLDIRNL